MISISTLITDNVDVSKGMLGYIGSDLSSKDRMSFVTRVNEASSLRKEMAKITMYKSDANLTAIDSYIGVLKSFVNAFSPDTTITFKWKTNKGKYVKTNSLHSELACVLYNKAALLAQQVALKVGSDYTNESLLQEASNTINTAYALVNYIINHLSYTFVEIKEIPEMTMENLKGFRTFLYAEYQFLKAHIAVCKFRNKKRAFVYLFTCARDLYHKAKEYFDKSSIQINKDVIGFCDSMSYYCYAYALYYEGYMSPEELQDYSKHGRGKAYYCMNKYFEYTGNLAESRNPFIKSAIIPLIKAEQNEKKREQNEIISHWKFSRTAIPGSDQAFHMKPVYCSIGETIDIPETYDLRESIGHERYAQLCSLEEKYKEKYTLRLQEFEKACNDIKESMNTAIEGLEYDAYEAAYVSELSIPKPCLSHLQRVYKKEAEKTLAGMEAEYSNLKQKYQMMINQVDDAYGDIINLMNKKPQVFPQNIRSYSEVNLKGYIEGKRTAYNGVLSKEKDIMTIKKDTFFPYIFENTKDKLLIMIRKLSVDLDDNEESMYNVLIKRKTMIDRWFVDFNQEMDRVEKIVTSRRALLNDFFSGVKPDDIEASFDKYISLCDEETSAVLSKFRGFRMYITDLQNGIAACASVAERNQCIKKKINLYRTLINDVKVYFKLVEFYESINPEMSHNINGLIQSKTYLDKLYNTFK